MLAAGLPGIDGADFFEQLGARAHGALVRWIDEGELRDVTKSE